MNDASILVGDVRERLREIPDGSVHCCVTSPPYWGLRDYGTAKWDGGDPAPTRPACVVRSKLAFGRLVVRTRNGSTNILKRIVGWSPTCSCDAPVIPCAVLDPFTGSGTVAVVALKHGRRFIGCELNPKYAEIASGRINGDFPLFNRVEVK